jgi:DNA-binding CsgD family transcriptional regulator
MAGPSTSLAAPRSNDEEIQAEAVASLAEVEYRLGDWGAAYATSIESLGLAYAGGRRELIADRLAQLALLEAGLGREEPCRGHAEQAISLARQLGNQAVVVSARAALGSLALGLGLVDEAVEHLEPLAAQHQPEAWAQELVEAYVRRSEHDKAGEMLRVLESAGHRRCSRSDLGAVERCRGLLALEHDFERHFERALELNQSEPFAHGRTELCYAQRLRRAGRRVAARGRLRSALETFANLGARPWAETARQELEASGERSRRRAEDTRDDLTASELRVALVVAEGATNREAAGRLFLSEKTIETHLSRIYRKLGVRSRTALAHWLSNLGEPSGSGQPASS